MLTGHSSSPSLFLFLCTVTFTPHQHFVLRIAHSFIKEATITDLLIVAYLKVKEGLTKPVMHDGGLSCIIVEFLPDELSHERLDQQAAAENWQVVSTKQQRNQQNQATVNLP